MSGAVHACSLVSARVGVGMSLRHKGAAYACNTCCAHGVEYVGVIMGSLVRGAMLMKEQTADKPPEAGSSCFAADPVAVNM